MDDDCRLEFENQVAHGIKICDVAGMVGDSIELASVRMAAHDRDGGAGGLEEEMANGVEADETAATNNEDRAYVVRRGHCCPDGFCE